MVHCRSSTALTKPHTGGPTTTESLGDHSHNALDHARVLSLIVRTEAALSLALERMAETTVRAPIVGTALKESVEDEQINSSATSGVNEGTALMRMADLTTVRVLMAQSNLGRVPPRAGGLRQAGRTPRTPLRRSGREDRIPNRSQARHDLLPDSHRA